MRLRHRGVLPLISLVLLTACGTATPESMPTVPVLEADSVEVTGGQYLNISPAELAAMLEHQDFILVNTHIPYEGEIEATDAFIPFEENGPQRVNDYPADKRAKIVLYCQSGRMSALVAQALVKAGYTNIWNLYGGMAAWEQAGYPLLQKE